MRPLRTIGVLLGFVVLLAAIYVGAYYATMDREIIDSRPLVYYRFGEEWSVTFFAPAHEFDRQTRPHLWEGEVDVLGEWDAAKLRGLITYLRTIRKE